jgi:zinc finger RNA-binding protein
VVQYNCKLCECKFNDINAKDMHLRGRRHRISYKKKVNPDIKIDNKPNPKTKRAAEERMRMIKKRNDSHWKMDDVWAMKEEMRKMEDELYARFGGGASGKKAESFDDRHVLAKHQTIYPDETELNAVQEIVTRVEKALKIISDKLCEEEKQKAEELKVTDPESTSEDASSNTTTPEDDAVKFRELKGVMRIGILAKGLLLKGDKDACLAVLCHTWPTKTLLGRIFKAMTSSLTEVAPDDKYENCLRMDEGCIVVKATKEPLVTLKILLTSPQCRSESEAEEKTEESPATEESEKSVADRKALDRSRLNKDRCLGVLSELRHCKWFEARASGLASCVIIVRVIYDLVNRVPSWSPLSKWAVELLAEKALSCSPSSFLSPGDALRRVIETLASGVLLPGGCGLMDPCERDKHDAAATLTDQDREDLTASAQHALRLITFKSIHKVLGIEQLSHASAARKRCPEGAVVSDIAAKVAK